jgi:hypothetical protein
MEAELDCRAVLSGTDEAWDMISFAEIMNDSIPKWALASQKQS